MTDYALSDSCLIYLQTLNGMSLAPKSEKLLICDIRPTQKSLHSITKCRKASIITRLRVHFSDLHEHRFDDNFACESPMCICDSGIESTTHNFLHCHQYSFHRRNLLDKVSVIVGNDITQLPDDQVLFGNVI